MSTIPSDLPIPAETPSTLASKTPADPTRLIYLTALGIILSLALAFSVPTLPWLWPIASLVMLATLVGTFITSTNVEKTLATVPLNTRIWFRPGKRQDFNRYYIVAALRIIPNLFLMGQIFIIGQWWINKRDWDAFNIMGAYWAVGSLAYLFIVLMWSHEGSFVDRALLRIPVQIALGILLFVGAVVLSFNSVYILGLLKAGQAAPWPKEWALVQSAVEAKFPYAVLTNLGATRDFAAPHSYSAALQTSFSFKRDDGTTLFVTLSDTNPEASLQINEIERNGNDLYTQTELNNLKSLYPHILFGPRDALNAALANLGADAPPPDNSIGPGIRLHLSEPNSPGDTTFNNLHRSAAWSVEFYPLTIWVDAETGQILLVEHPK